MTLEEAKVLLNSHNIPFELREFQDEKEYWHHVAMFPNTQNAKPCKVIAMVVRSNNGKKDIELQFNEAHDGFHFEELRFGDFGYELFDCEEEILADEILRIISEIRHGRLIFLDMNDIKNQRWMCHAWYDLNDDGAFGQSGFERIMKRFNAPKSFLEKLRNTEVQYEIYDWNTYQCIIK